MRRALKISLFAGATVIALLGAAFGVLQSGWGKQRLADYLSAEVSDPGVMELSIGELRGLVPWSFDLADVSISDADGAYLQVARLTFDLDVMAALSERFKVSNAIASGVRVLRLPADDTAETGSVDEPLIPLWPSEFSLEDFQVTDIWVAPEIAGQATTLRAGGRIVPDAGEGVDIVLDIAGEPEGGLEAVVFLRHDPEADVISLATEISEPAGGILARLLELPDDAPVLLQVVGEGPADNWQGEVHAAFGAAEWNGGFAIASHDTTRVTISGRANVLPFVDPAYQPLIGPDLEVQAVADIIEGGAIEIAEATLNGATSSLSTQGRLGLADGRADMAFTVQIPDLAPYALLAGEEVTGGLAATGTLRGALRAPTFEAEINLSHPAYESYASEAVALKLSGGVQVEGDSPAAGEISGTARVRGLSGAPSELNLLLGPEFTLDFTFAGNENGPARFEALTLKGRNLDVEATGTLDLASEIIETQLSFRIPDLSPLAIDLGLAMGGQIAGKAKGGFALASQSGDLAASLKITNLALDDEMARALAGPTVQIETSVAVEESGRIRIDRLDVVGSGAQLAYRGAVAADFADQDGRLQAEIPDLAKLSDALGTAIKGTLRADATLDGPIEALVVEGALSTDGLDIDGFAVEHIDAGFAARDLAGTPAGNFTVDIETPGAPAMNIRSSYLLAADQTLTLPDLVAATPGGNSLSADLRVDLTRGLAEGRADVAMENLAELVALADAELTGQAQAALALSATSAGQQNATLTLQAHNLAPDETTRITALDASGELTDILGSPAFKARLDAREALGDGFHIDTLQATIDGDLAGVGFDAGFAGEMGVPVTFTLAGEARQEGDAIALRLDRLDGKAGHIPLALRQVLQARLGPGQAMHADGVLDVGGGDVALDVEIDTETDAKITVSALPLGLLKTWLPLRGESGALNASLRITGPSDNTQGTLDATANDLRVDLDSDEVEAPPVAVAFSSAWGGGSLSASAQLSGVPGSSAQASATLPFTLSLAPFATSISPDDPLNASVNLEGDLTQISALLPLGEDRLSGMIDAEVTAAGVLNQPSLTGRAALNNGRYESFDADAVIDDLNLVLLFDGQEIVIERLEATDGDAGRLSGEGSVMLGTTGAAATPELAHLKVRLAQFFLLRRDDVVAPFDGEITASRDAGGMALRGELVSQPVEIRIPERLPLSAIELNPIEINSGEEITAKPVADKAGAEPPLPILLDIGLTFPRQLFVRGRGLDSEWRGALNIGGTADVPVVSGGLDLIRGRFEFVDKTFDLSTGSIRLDGSDPPDPEINIVAEADAGEILARVTITGRASAIELAFESDPALPRDEILAHILFGKSASEISAFQAAQLARTVATLSGSGGPDIVGQVREVLGVDDISVVTDGNGASGAALSVGKYVVDGVYLRAQQGVAEGSSKAGVEVEITDSITVESDVGANATASTWLNWQFKY